MQTNKSQDELEISGEEQELSPEEYLKPLLQRAKQATRQLSGLIAMKKNAALLAMADGLEAGEEAILKANEEDLSRYRCDHRFFNGQWHFCHEF